MVLTLSSRLMPLRQPIQSALSPQLRYTIWRLEELLLQPTWAQARFQPQQEHSWYIQLTETPRHHIHFTWRLQPQEDLCTGPRKVAMNNLLSMSSAQQCQPKELLQQTRRYCNTATHPQLKQLEPGALILSIQEAQTVQLLVSLRQKAA